MTANHNTQLGCTHPGEYFVWANSVCVLSENFSPVATVARSDDHIRGNEGSTAHEAPTNAPSQHDLVGELP